MQAGETTYQKHSDECDIGRVYFGALGWRLKAKCLQVLMRSQKMITICEEFASEYRVEFNAQKTVSSKFGQQC